MQGVTTLRSQLSRYTKVPPEKLVTRVCDWFRARGVDDMSPYRLVDEDVEFRLPLELRRELALAESQS